MNLGELSTAGRIHRPTPALRGGSSRAQNMSSLLRILIVDDSGVTRRILSTIVRSRNWTVCGEANDGWSAVKKFQELKPDVVLLDLAMPDSNGIDVARTLTRPY